MAIQNKLKTGQNFLFGNKTKPTLLNRHEDTTKL